MKDQQQQDEQNQIRLYEIMRGELDTPYVAEASLDNTLSAIQIEGEEAGWFNTSFAHPAQPINYNIKSQEVKKQNGNT